ncbi:PLP-dependent aminotransferase family protein [Pseudidiomarina sediminum]|uniref:aminotransferase-like domain-containing protein n=1 Tax=Pseudidiomarina sediminum TaxID=431675 RepID=UPI001C93B539|nr:PLP-dependent aminotransferase family protein [Pseudidiomarina sediminum]MBY6064682.1 PLP-dependent aminotransferase family protein [Pseudidiomarina sediminum]
MKKYQRLAEQLRSQIESKIWLPGQKLPSLREQAKRSGLSMMTVVHAYQMLESQGYIRAHERSGYVVAPPVTNAEMLYQRPEAVSVNDFVFEVLQASRDIHTLSLGFAYPDPALSPRQQLNKSIAAASKRIELMTALDNLPPGNQALRQLIAQRYAARGLEVHPDGIVITAGALEALSLSLQAVTHPGDSVIIEAPAFYGALQTLERLGLKAVTVPTDPMHGLDLEALAQALNDHDIKACWLMSNFQNPVGYSLTRTAKQRVAALLRQYQVVLVEDDVYGELYEGTTAPETVKHFDTEDSIMLCSSFSKCLVAGFRIGWVVAGKRALAVQKLQLMSTLATSAPMQLSLVDYLATKNYEQHLDDLRKTLAVRKQEMYQFLCAELGDIATVHHHAGGYFLWLVFAEYIDTTQIYKAALERNITLAPGKLFALNERFNHGLRVNASFALTHANKQLLRAFFAELKHHLPEFCRP